MKSIAIDISRSVFNNDTEAIMYVTEDNEVEPNVYIFAIPVISFSWSAKSEDELERFYPYNVFGDKRREQLLLNAMKRALHLF